MIRAKVPSLVSVCDRLVLAMVLNFSHSRNQRISLSFSDSDFHVHQRTQNQFDWDPTKNLENSGNNNLKSIWISVYYGNCRKNLTPKKVISVPTQMTEIWWSFLLKVKTTVPPNSYTLLIYPQTFEKPMRNY